ncbi:MAG: nucleotidyltransferase domain-containing protein [Hymenobacteraceae bacterium]|nr:nucleotidyltransferase domain-containing protein [Hymenobacteraceae bacterium]
MEPHKLAPAILTRPAAVELVQRFAAAVRRVVPLRQGILFGSYAHGTPHQWSDVDVALISDAFGDAGFLNIRPFARLMWDYADIEPHTFSTKRFENEAGDPFIKTIKRTGIVVA